MVLSCRFAPLLHRVKAGFSFLSAFGAHIMGYFSDAGVEDAAFGPYLIFFALLHGRMEFRTVFDGRILSG
jgi:hypothetical protein